MYRKQNVTTFINIETELTGLVLICKEVSCVLHYILSTTVEYMEKTFPLFNTNLFCADDQEIAKPSFDFYSCKSSFFTSSASQRSFCHSKFSSPKSPTIPISSISVSPTNRKKFSFLISSVIKSNDSKPARAPSQTSHLSSLPIKSSKRFFQSSTQACQATFSQNQKVFNFASLLQVSELLFQCNATAALPITIIPLRSSVICIFC